LRLLQKKLAEEITVLVHGRDEYEFAVKASEILFNNNTTEILSQLSEAQLLQVMDGVPNLPFAKSALEAGVDIVTLVSDSGVFPSKGEARKMIQNGGVLINKMKAEGVGDIINADKLLHGKYLLVQKGKKNYPGFSAWVL